MPMSHQTSCVIFAKNLKVLTEFYQKVLQANVPYVEDSYSLLYFGESELVIHAIPANIAANIAIQAPPEIRSACAIKPVFYAESLSDLASLCEQLGGGLKALSSAWEIRGAKVLDGWDPEGNVIQFRERLPTA